MYLDLGAEPCFSAGDGDDNRRENFMWILVILLAMAIVVCIYHLKVKANTIHNLNAHNAFLSERFNEKTREAAEIESKLTAMLRGGNEPQSETVVALQQELQEVNRAIVLASEAPAVITPQRRARRHEVTRLEEERRRIEGDIQRAQSGKSAVTAEAA
jgi:cell division protein FtsN